MYIEKGACLPAKSWGVMISKAQRVQGAVLGTLGRHNVFGEFFFFHFREAERVLGAKICFQEGPKSLTNS